MSACACMCMSIRAAHNSTNLPAAATICPALLNDPRLTRRSRSRPVAESMHQMGKHEAEDGRYSMRHPVSASPFPYASAALDSRPSCCCCLRHGAGRRSDRIVQVRRCARSGALVLRLSTPLSAAPHRSSNNSNLAMKPKEFLHSESESRRMRATQLCTSTT